MTAQRLVSLYYRDEEDPTYAVPVDQVDFFMDLHNSQKVWSTGSQVILLDYTERIRREG